MLFNAKLGLIILLGNKIMTSSQTSYFDLLKSWLGELWGEYLKSGADPHDFANQYCDREFNHSSSFNHLDRIKDIKEKIVTYWQDNSSDVVKFLRNDGGIKTNYYGDISPLPNSFSPDKALSICDNIIIPCGVEKLVHMFDKHDQRNIYCLLVKHSLQMLALEPYANSENVIKPIIIVPNIIHHDEGYSKVMFEASFKTTIETINELYDESFENIDEVLEFSLKFKSAKEMAINAKKNAINWEPDIKNGDLVEYYYKYQEEVGRHSNEPEYSSIFNLILGKRAQSADALFITNYWGSTPLTDNDASYLSLVDYLKYTSPGKLEEQFVDQIFHKTDLPFFNFSNFRSEYHDQNDIVRNLRNSIVKHVSGLNCDDIFSFERASNKVKIGLKQEFEDYHRSLNQLKINYDKDTLLNLLGILVFGSITITCAMWPAFMNLASLSGVIGTSNFLKTVKDGHDYRKKLEEIKKGYIAILCK